MIISQKSTKASKDKPNSLKSLQKDKTLGLDKDVCFYKIEFFYKIEEGE